MTARKAAPSAPRFSAIMTGVAYATSAEMARELGPFEGYPANAEAMLRVMRNHRRAANGEAFGYEKLSIAPVPLDHAALADKALSAHAIAAWDKALELGEAARLSQCAGQRRRADRHDRPRHGLRHHRHRARFRAGEIQEARRRRLFQDHQPRRPRRAALARLWRARDRRHRHLRGRPRDAERRPGDQSRDAAREGLHAGQARRAGDEPRRRLRHQIRLQQMDARRRIPDRRRSRSRPKSSKIRTSTCSRISASRAPRSTPPMSMSAAP